MTKNHYNTAGFEAKPTSPIFAPNQAWLALLTALLYQGFVWGICVYSFTFWIAPWSNEFGIKPPEIMVAMTSGIVVSAALGPLIGKLLGANPLQYIVAGGLSVFGVGMLIIAHADAMWQITAVYALMLSVGKCFAGPLSAQWLVVKWFSRRGAALGLVSIGSSLGGFFLPPLVTMLISEFGWRMTHSILGLSTLCVILPLVLTFVKVPKTPVAPTFSTSNATKNAPSPLIILRSEKFWMIIVALLPLVFSMIIFTSTLGPFAMDRGVEPQQAAYLMSTLAISMIVGKLASGALCDIISFRIVYLVIMVCLFWGVALMTIEPEYLLLLLNYTLIGLSAGSALTMMAAIANKLYDTESFAIVLGLMSLTNAASPLLIPITAQVREIEGSYDAVWFALLVTIVICPIAILKLKPSEPKSESNL